MLDFVGSHYVELAEGVFAVFFVLLCFAIATEHMPRKN